MTRNNYYSKEEVLSSRNAFYKSIYDEFVKTKATSKKSDIVLYVEGFISMGNSLCERAWVEVNGQVAESKAESFHDFKFYPVEKFKKERCEKLLKSSYKTFPLFSLNSSTQTKFNDFRKKYIQENPTVDYDFDKHYYNLNALEISCLSHLNLFEDTFDLLVEDGCFTHYDFEVLKKAIFDFMFRKKRLNQEDENYDVQVNLFESLIEYSEDPEFADYFYCYSFEFLQPIIEELLDFPKLVNYSNQSHLDW